MFQGSAGWLSDPRALDEVRRRLDEAKLTKENELPERGLTGPSVCWIG
jgi:hypothetical protein